ncbi:JAB domain-containing protein [Sphingomonas daechungensis]|uniref:JAB domain-containing protein n=1 Tax=Sphingomonas daechungensis TaxID=1176646 RepID=UPI0037833B36
MRYQRAEQPLKLDGPEAAQALFAGCFAESDPARECLWIAHVDSELNCIHLTRHDGLESEADLPIRAIIADALLQQSSGLLLAHNHPSGDPTPSRMDCLSTRRLAAAASALDCQVLDHLIFAGERSISFRSLGYL